MSTDTTEIQQYEINDQKRKILMDFRQRLWEHVYNLITWNTIAKIPNSKERALQIKRYIHDFDENLKKIVDGQKWENINDEIFYHEIVHKSLDLLLSKLKMDYAWIWLITEDKFHPVHQVWFNKLLDHKVIYSQIQEAEEMCQNNWKIISLFPSDSKDWWVDAVFTFKNLKDKTVWYLLLDDIKNKRELTNFEIEKICNIFYDKLDKLIIEFELSRVNMQNVTIKNKLDEVIQQSRIDPLTSLLNRRTWDEVFWQRLADVARWETNVSVALVDIDFFKNINDTHWHIVWDTVLKKVAEIFNIWFTEEEKILHIRRSTDDFVRYGWEEFLCILNHTDLIQACVYLNKLKDIISQIEFKWEGWKTFNITFSAWVTLIQRDDVDYKSKFPMNITINNIIARADSALYDAKRTWRNKVKPFLFDKSFI
jgi:diguanylate cyclase (GGDEF)-like protein